MSHYLANLPASDLLFLAYFVPACFGSGLFLIVRDLPAVKRFCGEAQ